MKRAILTIFLLFAVMAGVCAAEAVLVPTLAVNTEDQVKGVLPARPLYIPRVSQVVRGQSFELVSGVVDPEFRNEKLQLNGTLTIKTPDGSEKIVFKNAKMFALPRSSWPRRSSAEPLRFPVRKRRITKATADMA